jgi:hypothetical protein
MVASMAVAWVRDWCGVVCGANDLLGQRRQDLGALGRVEGGDAGSGGHGGALESWAQQRAHEGGHWIVGRELSGAQRWCRDARSSSSEPLLMSSTMPRVWRADVPTALIGQRPEPGRHVMADFERQPQCSQARCSLTNRISTSSHPHRRPIPHSLLHREQTQWLPGASHSACSRACAPALPSTPSSRSARRP